LNNFMNYTQTSLNRPYSYLYKNKQGRPKKWLIIILSLWKKKKTLK
jgi:hypothetical protein